MKSINIYLIFFAFSMLLSCSQGGQNNANETATDNTGTEKVTGKKKKKKGVKNAAGMKAAGNSAYWTGLQKELGLSDEKIADIKALNTAYNDEIKNLRAQNPESARKLVVAKRLEQKEKVKNLLGEELNQKKLAWDKEWNARNSLDKTGKKGK